MCRFHVDLRPFNLSIRVCSVLWVPVGQKHNREHGEDHPIGANTVTAPATVSGLVCTYATGKPGRRANMKAASQETCRTTG